MTECTQSSFGFEGSGRREIVARFDGGTISSDGGAFLLRQVDKRLNLLARFGQCFLDGRNQALVEHSIAEMVSQRVYGLALGYEDLNDHEQLRTDPVFGILAGKQDMAEPLAGKSTLNRMELGTGVNNRYKKITFWKEAVDELLVNAFIESHEEAPAEIVLDMDTTDMPLHGKQEGRFFHGCYDSYCYLPLYVFCGDHVLCARMREANHDAAFGCRQEMERIVKQIRTAWPEVKIVLRGDSGFCRNELMSWCESRGVDFVFGLARNKRLRKIIGLQMHQATVEWKQTGQPARVFTEFLHSTKKTKTGGWDRERRVAAKAEHIDGKENPRFVVTSLTSERWAAKELYEELYCERGNMENRIKEQFSLFADRVSAETIRANQMRLYLSAMAYNRRARLQPALIVALPLALAVLSWSPEGLKAWTAFWSLFVWAGGTALMTQLARDRGKQKEKALYESWGGKPTTRLLRYAGSDNSVLVTRRHNSIQKAIPDLHIPSEAEEASDPAHSDKVYDTCVRWLLEHTRDTKKFPLVFEENCNYGFRRNLWGMRAIGIGLATICMLAGLAAPILLVLRGAAVSPISYGAVACTLGLLLFWLLACNSHWVKLAADAFAERLLAASEVLSPAKASPAPRATKAPKKPKEV